MLKKAIVQMHSSFSLSCFQRLIFIFFGSYSPTHVYALLHQPLIKFGKMNAKKKQNNPLDVNCTLLDMQEHRDHLRFQKHPIAGRIATTNNHDILHCCGPEDGPVQSALRRLNACDTNKEPTTNHQHRLCVTPVQFTWVCQLTNELCIQENRPLASH